MGILTRTSLILTRTSLIKWGFRTSLTRWGFWQNLSDTMGILTRTCLTQWGFWQEAVWHNGDSELVWHNGDSDKNLSDTMGILTRTCLTQWLSQWQGGMGTSIFNFFPFYSPVRNPLNRVIIHTYHHVFPVLNSKFVYTLSTSSFNVWFQQDQFLPCFSFSLQNHFLSNLFLVKIPPPLQSKMVCLAVSLICDKRLLETQL